MFWPKEIWGMYGETLESFKKDENSSNALACLNHMVANALSHVDTCLEYLSKLQDPSIFAFCAIPQVMAIGTLEACYNNHGVFTGVVKMRRGETAKIMWFMRDYTDACVLFRHYAKLIAAKAHVQAKDDPNRQKVIELCQRIEDITTERLHGEERNASDADPAPLPLTTRILFLLISLLFGAYAWKLEKARELFGIPAHNNTTIIDIINMFIAVVLIMYSCVSIVEKMTAIRY
jgi:farnesyl-diphosphate farnesyltransferase